MRGGTDCFFVVVAVFHFERPFGQPQHVSPRHIRRNFLRCKFFATGKGWRLSASPGPRTRPYASFHSALPPEGPMLESPHFAGRGFGKAKRRSSRRSWPAEFSRFCQQNWCISLPKSRRKSLETFQQEHFEK